ncbi:MAG: hypothetical protein J0L97_03875 [Alphaproteobacteria bacterium]|nr:hypothetical protein [Alphaproteobacteria bacterium]
MEPSPPPALHWTDRAHAWFRWGNVLFLFAITLVMIAGSSPERHSLLKISANLCAAWMVAFVPIYPILSLLWLWKGRGAHLARRMLRATLWGLWLLLWGAMATLMHA